MKKIISLAIILLFVATSSYGQNLSVRLSTHGISPIYNAQGDNANNFFVGELSLNIKENSKHAGIRLIPQYHYSPQKQFAAVTLVFDIYPFGDDNKDLTMRISGGPGLGKEFGSTNDSLLKKYQFIYQGGFQFYSKGTEFVINAVGNVTGIKYVQAKVFFRIGKNLGIGAFGEKYYESKFQGGPYMEFLFQNSAKTIQVKPFGSVLLNGEGGKVEVSGMIGISFTFQNSGFHF